MPDPNGRTAGVHLVKNWRIYEGAKAQRTSSPAPSPPCASIVPPACVTMCFTIASPSPGAPRGAGAVGAVEALEEPAQVGLVDADAVVRPAEDHRVAVALDRERERRAGARVADRVLGEVLGDDPQHPRPDLELDRGVALDRQGDAGAARAVLELGRDGLELRPNGHGPQRDDARPGLELGEEEHLVDQLPDLPDLAPRLVDELGDVLAGQRRHLEQREQSCERRPELVRHGRREPGSELLVRRQVAAAAQVDEPLAAAVDVVRNDERHDPGLAGEQPVGDRRPLPEAVDRLSRASARADHPVGLVEHDDGLAALLEQHPAAFGVGVHAHGVLTDA